MTLLLSHIKRYGLALVAAVVGVLVVTVKFLLARNSRLIIILGLMTLTSCSGIKTIPDFPCPDRPELLTTEAEASDEVRAIVTENYIRLIEYAEKLEVRAGCR